MNEFELIRHYFTRPVSHTRLGVGDDAAIFSPRHGHELHVSVDMLVTGRHFFPDVDPFKLGHKTLAVNLSDMAAMGATPKWVLLAAALPVVDEDWVANFARGFFALADRYQVDVIGGDTTRGPLTLSVTIIGETPQGCALRRDQAKVGDDIWISGMVGSAAIGLAYRQQQLSLTSVEQQQALAALEQPEPRVALGQALLSCAHAAIDVSDGLLADLGHILQRSGGLGATLWWDQIPVNALWRDAAWFKPEWALAGGDDYELCFTAPRSARENIVDMAHRIGIPVSRIGQVEAAHTGTVVLDTHGQPMPIERTGFDHFATS